MSWAIGQNVVYLVTEQGAISEMNAADGGLRWCTPDDGELLAPGVPPNPSLVADQERVYATDGASGYVVALSASDGKHQWRQ